METNLLPISQIIKSARQAGATFGHGDPKIHLAYLTKLRLLPQAIRRKIGNKIVGCYPEYVIPLINKIEGLKEAGLTYPQIKFQLQAPTIQEEIYPQPSTFYPATAGLFSTLHHPSSSNTLAFLIVGLLLGYLLATGNGSRTGQTTPMTNDKSLITMVSPLDGQSQTMLKVVTGKSSNGNEPIYLIAVPKQNFDQLGKININELAPVTSN